MLEFRSLLSLPPSQVKGADHDYCNPPPLTPGQCESLLACALTPPPAQ